MIDKLKKQSPGKFSSEELEYSRTRIKNELEQYEQELTAGDCKKVRSR